MGMSVGDGHNFASAVFPAEALAWTNRARVSEYRVRAGFDRNRPHKEQSQVDGSSASDLQGQPSGYVGSRKIRQQTPTTFASSFLRRSERTANCRRTLR